MLAYESSFMKQQSIMKFYIYVHSLVYMHCSVFAVDWTKSYKAKRQNLKNVKVERIFTPSFIIYINHQFGNQALG